VDLKGPTSKGGEGKRWEIGGEREGEWREEEGPQVLLNTPCPKS